MINKRAQIGTILTVAIILFALSFSTYIYLNQQNIQFGPTATCVDNPDQSDIGSICSTYADETSCISPQIEEVSLCIWQPGYGYDSLYESQPPQQLPPASCGDGVCDTDENTNSCPQDCPAIASLPESGTETVTVSGGSSGGGSGGGGSSSGSDSTEGVSGPTGSTGVQGTASPATCYCTLKRVYDIGKEPNLWINGRDTTFEDLSAAGFENEEHTQTDIEGARKYCNSLKTEKECLAGKNGAEICQCLTNRGSEENGKFLESREKDNGDSLSIDDLRNHFGAGGVNVPADSGLPNQNGKATQGSVKRTEGDVKWYTNDYLIGASTYFMGGGVPKEFLEKEGNLKKDPMVGNLDTSTESGQETLQKGMEKMQKIEEGTNENNEIIIQIEELHKGIVEAIPNFEKSGRVGAYQAIVTGNGVCRDIASALIKAINDKFAGESNGNKATAEGITGIMIGPDGKPGLHIWVRVRIKDFNGPGKDMIFDLDPTWYKSFYPLDPRYPQKLTK